MNLKRKERIELILNEHFIPTHYEVLNESHMHRVPDDAETHFKIILVSARFEGLSRIARHRLLHQALTQELSSGLHALSLSLHTPAEWQKQQMVIPSPKCAHQ